MNLAGVRSKVSTYWEKFLITHAYAKSLLDTGFFSLENAARECSQTFYYNYTKRQAFGELTTIITSWKHSPPKDWTAAATTVRNRGTECNAATWITAFPLYFYNRTEQMSFSVDRVARLTHSSNDAAAGAQLQAYAISLVLKNKKMKELEFLAALVEYTSKSLPDSVRQKFYTRMMMVLDYAERAEPKEKLFKAIGVGTSPLDAVPVAIYCAAIGRRSDSPFETTLHAAMLTGGCTDAIGTMACAIAGAWSGFSGIPDEMVGIWDGQEQVYTLAEELYKYVSTLHDPNGPLSTFENWPHLLPSAGAMARIGLYYTGSDDTVKCHFCRFTMSNWTPGDPYNDHQKFNRNCIFVKDCTATPVYVHAV
ncbi:uncharacterized protein LOC129587005 [Paramacrobiotus metropolitanus]|uniref:uncharacterized protein LOC129587005 n=1 Tax=Paramacrobiotus metropolitanus TaxID=2943436 RepID=UPI002445BB29|nr:uncharacterized protein LOC129587005 [Paramacrobiotus metropolitanus]